MAALAAGVQYGLSSSHNNFHENKSLIFVKLTDSAQRAIDEYLRNRNNTSQNPTIRFRGNEGQLIFPSTQSGHGSTSFTFSLSGNQDIEGPQGGFECIQQTGPKSLESLGALPCKMRIQANDDVYETTRHRMAVAEENNKNKCTRVIKESGPDIGRKVKVKLNATQNPLPTPSNSRSRDGPSTSISSLPKQSYSSRTIANIPSAASNRPEKKNNPIMRRPLKERLVHYLALRPYKKPELLERLTREGYSKDRDGGMTTVLKQISFVRDNTFHLLRHVWNDVQEDWPFYTPEDKAMLKRRKPQNLTPPGSSDGSSGSGQSPNSTHPGSPPTITAPPPSLLNNKRPGYFEGSDGFPTKKPRISHYRKSETVGSGALNAMENGRTGSSNNNSVSVIPGASGSSANSVGISLGVIDASNWEQRHQQHPHDRRDRTGNSDVLLRGTGGYAGKPYSTTPTSDNDDIGLPSSSRNVGTSGNNGNDPAIVCHKNSHSSVAHSNSSSGRRQRLDRTATVQSDRNTAVDYVSRSASSAILCDGCSAGSSNEVHADRRRAGNNVNAGGNSYNDLPITTDFSTNGNGTVSTSTGFDLDLSDSSKYPDYLTCYTTISSAEQRRRYKTEFNELYVEYRNLYTKVHDVSKRFGEFEDRWKEAKEKCNTQERQLIEEQICREYIMVKHDPVHKDISNRFQYLHGKLAHIKKLVYDYDRNHY